MSCPLGTCEHSADDHFATDYDRDFVPMDPMCRVEDCPCGRLVDSPGEGDGRVE